MRRIFIPMLVLTVQGCHKLCGDMFLARWIAVSPKLWLMSHEKPKKRVNTIGAMLLFLGTMQRSYLTKVFLWLENPWIHVLRIVRNGHKIFQNRQFPSFLPSLAGSLHSNMQPYAHEIEVSSNGLRHHNTRTHKNVHHNSIQLTFL